MLFHVLVQNTALTEKREINREKQEEKIKEREEGEEEEEERTEGT